MAYREYTLSVLRPVSFIAQVAAATCEGVLASFAVSEHLRNS